MAHFAKLNDQNIVLEVHVINNSVLDAKNEEESGIKFLTEWSGGYSNWKQTSFNGSFRGNFAGIGFDYLPDLDIYMPPKCHEEAVLDDVLAKWLCPNHNHDLQPIT